MTQKGIVSPPEKISRLRTAIDETDPDTISTVYQNQRIVKNNYKQKIHLANQKKIDSDEKNALFVKLSLKSNPIGIGLCE